MCKMEGTLKQGKRGNRKNGATLGKSMSTPPVNGQRGSKEAQADRVKVLNNGVNEGKNLGLVL